MSSWVWILLGQFLYLGHLHLEHFVVLSYLPYNNAQFREPRTVCSEAVYRVPVAWLAGLIEDGDTTWLRLL